MPKPTKFKRPDKERVNRSRNSVMLFAKTSLLRNSSQLMVEFTGILLQPLDKRKIAQEISPFCVLVDQIKQSKWRC